MSQPIYSRRFFSSISTDVNKENYWPELSRLLYYLCNSGKRYTIENFVIFSISIFFSFKRKITFIIFVINCKINCKNFVINFVINCKLQITTTYRYLENYWKDIEENVTHLFLFFHLFSKIKKYIDDLKSFKLSTLNMC